MWGLIIGSLYALVLWLKKEVPEKIFMRATNFLFYWYLVVTCIIVGIVILIFSLGGAVVTESEGIIGIIAGILVGSGLGIVIAALIVLLSLFSIIGAHLLRTSVKEVEGTFKWDRTRLVIGMALLLISLLISVGTN